MTVLAPAVRRALSMVMSAVLIAGCASGTIVLLPEKDGRPTSVVVKEGDRELILDQPYAAATITTFQPRAYRSSPQAVESQFGAALAAQPARAAAFTLYFIQGSDALTDESNQDVDRILAEIARRPVPDVLVIGHTDAVGSDPANDALGQQRADTMRAALIARGIAPENVRAISRGKRALAVPTADGVPEARNRRVEILVR
jgi:outer membrane protein OmpA-like peptidoglycan-associated protein